jgi:hypothetical protein
MEKYNISNLTENQQEVDRFIRNSTGTGAPLTLTSANGNGDMYKYEYESQAMNMTSNITFFVETTDQNTSENSNEKYRMIGMNLVENIAIPSIANVEVQIE